MHLMATYLPFLMHCALRTSEKVPSPFLPMSRYSDKAGARVAGGWGTRSAQRGGALAAPQGVQAAQLPALPIHNVLR